jgi:hypothetical protein
MDIMKTILDDGVKKLQARLDGAVEGIRYLLNKNDADITALVKAFLTYDSYAIYRAFGCCVPEGIDVANGDIPMYNMIAYMEWISHFIAYELLDDGCPALGFQKYEGDFVDMVCTSKIHEENVEPIILRSTEMEVSQKYGYRVACVDNVLPVLDFHQAQKLESNKWCQENDEEVCPPDEADLMRQDLAKFFGLL